MKSSPIRRIFAWFGLIALVPIGYLVYQGDMTVADGGLKAGIVLLAVFVAVRVVEFLLSGMAAVLERQVPMQVPEQVERRR